MEDKKDVFNPQLHGLKKPDKKPMINATVGLKKESKPVKKRKLKIVITEEEE